MMMIAILLLTIFNVFMFKEVMFQKKLNERLVKNSKRLTKSILSLKDSDKKIGLMLKAERNKSSLLKFQYKNLLEQKELAQLEVGENYIELASLCIEKRYNLIKIPYLIPCLGELEDEVFFKEVKHRAI